MSQKRILIVSHADDLHVDVLSTKLLAKGHSPFILKLDQFPRDYQFTQTYSQRRWRTELLHLPSGECLTSEQIGSVWLRKKAPYAYLTDELSAQEQAFADKETTHTLFGFLYGLNHCYWMNHPLAARHAAFKGEQLQRAVAMGFDIPPSIISNDPSAVQSFQQQLRSPMVFKAMSSSMLAAEQVAADERDTYGVHTTIIDADDEQALEAVALLPCHFQGYVDKAYEVRATVIGDKLFAARIDSQADPRTRVDYRDFSADIPYTAITLPAAVEKRCLAFVHSYGLSYGALDLMVTAQDDYIFLENNPGGQFWFIEQLVPQLTMMEHLADCLIAGLQADAGATAKAVSW
ncbi:MvdC/MvdD family ATP grasp protein [Idiomarina xiamenensis]|uniref:MvdD-like pre-ATP grasp domain-containing protein n=1 Tax=Idiomarina xiamenensis 10-D-4 TaxID=740709 RepID=K2JWB5_9GAMM|nr:hypothetical protein [Idiomarina xiamenensis]EKE87651.1 hypothetical protein A10D4_01115 [Idiomarina xiamenensis 10-D-4]